MFSKIGCSKGAEGRLVSSLLWNGQLIPAPEMSLCELLGPQYQFEGGSSPSLFQDVAGFSQPLSRCRKIFVGLGFEECDLFLFETRVYYFNNQGPNGYPYVCVTQNAVEEGCKI